MKKLKLLSILFLLIFSSCNPNDEDGISNSNNNNTDFAKNFGPSASRDFIGQIVNESDDPIAGATVKIGSISVQTDVNGVFIINGAQVHERFAYITAKKAGYIGGSRSVVPTSGRNNIKIMLLSNAPTSTVQAGTSATVSLPSGTKVVFDGAFQDQNGAAYSGSVSVSEFHLKPSNANVGNLMPGMLYAQAADGNAKVLQTFGMLHVELTGSGGQKLQIASGHTAQITMTIDASQMATAPASIPLWHFDEANGYWKEEGSATKEGDKYVGNVSHFSWWNCDTFSSTVLLTVTVVDSNQMPVNSAGVSLITNTNFNSYVELTNEDGQVSGVIPANQLLTLNVRNACGTIVYTAQIGPFASDALIPVEISNTVHTSNISGTFVKCDESPIDNGYVLLHYGNAVIMSAVSSGNFNFSTFVCNDNTSFELEGIDTANFQSTGRITYQLSYSETQVGSLRSCNSISEFITYQINNDNPIYIFDNIHAQEPQTLDGPNSDYTFTVKLNIYGNSATGYFSILAADVIPGLHTLPNVQMGLIRVTSPNSSEMLGIYNSPTNTINFSLNKFGPVGDYIDFTITGSYLQQGIVNTFTAQGHVKRDN